jgi:hypothetical protein
MCQETITHLLKFFIHFKTQNYVTNDLVI